MSNITEEAALKALATIATIDADMARAMVTNADGHDARIDLLKQAIGAAIEIASAVDSDMTAVGDGYDVCPQTGDTHSGNGTEDEGRGYALHQYACAAAALKAFVALSRTLAAYANASERAERSPHEVSAAKYLARLERL